MLFILCYASKANEKRFYEWNGRKGFTARATRKRILYGKHSFPFALELCQWDTNDGLEALNESFTCRNSIGI